MDNLIISAIPITLVEVVWPQVEPLLKLPIARSHGDITIESAKASLLSGQSMLLTVSDKHIILAAITLNVRHNELGEKSLYMPLVGGSCMEDWLLRVLEVSKAIAKDLGCTELRGIAVRKGWMRKLKKLGWNEVSTLVHYKIGE